MAITLDTATPMNYDFDTVIDRRNTNSVKWDLARERFGLEGVLPMWVADMDFRTPQPVADSLKRMVETGVFGYSTVPESYYRAVSAWLRKRHGWNTEHDWIVLTPGVMTGVHIAIKAFTSPGDRVIVHTPTYYPFFRAITNNGCEILDSPMRVEGGKYKIDFHDLERRIDRRTRLTILCSPHNPIGRVWEREELMELGQLCLDRDITVVSDEIHSDIVYDGFKHIPFASISEAFASRSVVCTAASKTFNLPGLRTSGIIIPNGSLRETFTETLRTCGISSPNMLGVAATEAAYRFGEPWLDELLHYLEGNLDLLEKYAAESIPGLRVTRPEGTFLAWLDFRGCGIDAERLGSFVREEARVGLQPGTLFGCREEGFERMNIGCPRSLLEEGLKRIAEAVRRLRAR